MIGGLCRLRFAANFKLIRFIGWSPCERPLFEASDIPTNTELPVDVRGKVKLTD